VQQAVNKMYHSPNKRVEVEMAVVRLCDERLSDGNDAVLSRIAELEAKLLSGQFSSNITSEPQKSVTKKEKAIAEIKQETEEKQEKSEKSKSMDKPSAAFWKDVLATLQVTNKMGWSLLKDSKVMLSNDELIISTENAITQNFLKDEDNKSNIAGIVKNLTSKDYKIKVSAEKQADEGDSFSELLSENSDDIQLF
jgi:DNA polymerase-3 subunit gamma/tau